MKQTEKPKIITGNKYGEILATALGIDASRVRRIVLDVQLENIVIAYVEMVGDERLLNISQSFEGVELKVINAMDVKQ